MLAERLDGVGIIDVPIAFTTPTMIRGNCGSGWPPGETIAVTSGFASSSRKVAGGGISR